MEWQNYEKVRDGRLMCSGDIIPRMILPATRARFEAQMQLIAGMTARAVVSESFDGLRMSYEIRSSSGSYTLRPRHMFSQITRRSSSVSCFGKVCPPFRKLREDFLLTLCHDRHHYYAGYGVMKPFDIPAKPNIMLLGENQVARCMALEVCDEYKVILQDRECIGCCARRAKMAKRPHESIIVSHLTAEDVERLMESPNALVYA